jgi:hypothetical protein
VARNAEDICLIICDSTSKSFGHLIGSAGPLLAAVHIMP